MVIGFLGGSRALGSRSMKSKARKEAIVKARRSVSTLQGEALSLGKFYHRQLWGVKKPNSYSSKQVHEEKGLVHV